MKANNTYNVVITNEAYNFTSTKYNTTLTGFTSSEAASNAAREALRDIAGEMGKGEKVFFSETLNAWILASPSRGIAGSVWYLTAKVVEVETEAPTETEKEEKTVEVEIYHDGDTCNAMAGGENPVIIGWVDRWFNNTFAAGMQFGIKARKAIAIEELTGRD